MNENKITPINVVDFLEHSGVKGMKWGVTNASSKGQGKSRQERRVDKTLKKADMKWASGIYTTKGAIAVHNNTANQMNNKHLPELNNRPQYKGKNLSANPKLKEQYFRDVLSLQDKAVDRAVKEVHGVSPSGKMKAKLSLDNDGRYAIEVASNIPGVVFHAQMAQDLPDNTFRFELTTDDNGFITAMDLAPIDLTHSEDTFDVAAFFEHSGIKGMKWGVRNSEKKAARASAKEAARTSAKIASAQHHSSRANKSKYMTTADLELAIKRIETEKKYNSLTQGASAKGHKTVKTVLGDIGKKSITEVGTKAASHAMKTIIFKKFKVDLGKTSFADMKV